jgi:hypothetical protein
MWSVGGGGGSDCRLLLFHRKIIACMTTRKKSGNVGVTSVEAFIQLLYFKIIIGRFSAYTR